MQNHQVFLYLLKITTMTKFRIFVILFFFSTSLAGFIAFSEQPEPIKTSKPKHSKKEIHKSSKELKVSRNN